MLLQQLQTLSTDGLYLVYQDATSRIGSHYVGGNPDMNYIGKQEVIIAAVQNKLSRRKEENT